MQPTKHSKVLNIITFLLFTASCLAFSIKSFGPDELYFLHHTWANIHNASINIYEVYPFPLLISLLSIIYKHLGLVSFVAWKPLFVILYLVAFYWLSKNKEHKWIYAYLFTVLILNRAIEIRPEPFATLAILYSLMISERNLGESSNVAKLILIMLAVAFAPRYLPITAVLIAYNFTINKNNKKRWFTHFSLATLATIAIYTILVGNPIDSIQHLATREDFREDFDLKYKFDRLFGNGYLLKIIILCYLTKFIIKLSKKTINALDIYFLTGLMLQLLFIIFFDKVPYEYVAQTIVLLVIWYSHNCSNKNNFLLHFNGSKISLAIFAMIILAITIEIKKNRDVFKYSITSIQASYSESTEVALLTKNLTPYQQLTNRLIFCAKYTGYQSFTNNYRWHPICMPDEYSIKIGRLLMTEESIKTIIQKKEGVINFKNGSNEIFLYPTN